MPVRTTAELANLIASQLPDNDQGLITPERLREVMTDQNDSTLLKAPTDIANYRAEVTEALRTSSDLEVVQQVLRLTTAVRNRIPPATGVNQNRGKFLQVGTTDALEYDDVATADLEGAFLKTASVSGNTLTLIAQDAAGNEVSVAYQPPHVTPVVSMHQRYAAWKQYQAGQAVPTFSVNDYTTSFDSMTDAITLTGAIDATNRRFVVSFWSENPLTRIDSGDAFESDNQLGLYTQARLRIGTPTGYVYTLDGLLLASSVNREYHLS